jgi:hypothetical protein
MEQIASVLLLSSTKNAHAFMFLRFSGAHLAMRNRKTTHLRPFHGLLDDIFNIGTALAM